MNWWISFILFILILFLYIHIQDQYKKVTETEIYEYDYESKTKLFNICRWKLPIIFSLELPDIPETNIFENLNIRDVRQYLGSPEYVHSTKLSYSSAMNIINTDSNGVLYSDRNSSLINSSKHWNEWFSNINNFLLPEYNVLETRDVIIGSVDSKTLTMYHKNNYSFLYVPNNYDNITVRLYPFKQTEFINPTTDKLYNEHYSQIDLYDDSSKIKPIEIIIQPGFLLYVPSYWFYSIKFTGNKNVVCKIEYCTAINYLANFKDHVIHFFQLQNSSISKPKEMKEIETKEEDVPAAENDVSVNNSIECDLLEKLKEK